MSTRVNAVKVTARPQLPHNPSNDIACVTTIFFLFVGLTQPRGRSWWLLPLALVALRGLTDLPWSHAWIRLTVAAIVWSLAAELPALLMRRLTQQQQKLTGAVETDSLTGARNRHGLTDLLGQMRGHAFLVILDLDFFKVYNDTFGHPAATRYSPTSPPCWRGKAGTPTW